jgi:hypothetical protein
MRLRSITAEELRKVKDPRCIYDKLVDNFINSGSEYAEVLGHTASTPNNCANNINAYIRNNEIIGVKAFSKGNRVFIGRVEE